MSAGYPRRGNTRRLHWEQPKRLWWWARPWTWRGRQQPCEANETLRRL